MSNHQPYDAALFAELYDVQPQAIAWMRPVWSDDGQSINDFSYTYANDEGLNYLNLTREQFSGLTISNSPTLTDELRQNILAEMTHVFKTGEASETVLFNPVLNKHARILRTRLRDGVLSVVQDITNENRVIHELEKQKQQLQENTRQLQEQKTLLDNILHNSSNGISVSEFFRDDEGKVVDVQTILANEAAVKYVGFPKDIYLSKRATEIEPGLIGSPYYQMCIKTLETGEPFAMQYLVEATGKWLELTVSKMNDNHLIQIFTDVTAVKEVHLQLEKAATTLKTVFDAAQTGMFTFAPEYNEMHELIDFRFVMVNSTIAGYARQEPQQLQGASGVQWFPGYLTNGEFELYKTCFETGQSQQMELHYHLDVHDYYFDLQCVKVDDQLLVTLTDHTSLRKSQLQLEQTVKALERSNSHLEDFAHAASHDMKEPLRKIRTFADRLKSKLDSRMTEEEKEIFGRIETSAERMQLLVDDLLEFSHVSELPKQVEAIDLAEKLRKVLSDLELPIEEKGAEIIIHPLPTVQGNRRQLQQLFQNLISNALKYSKPNVPPLITISASIVKGSEIQITGFDYEDQLFHLIEVSDNGIGFDQEHAEHIFKMFQRLHGKAEYSGTGVGLSIARKVVENHNGFIWAEGEVDKGAVFKIMLPVS